MQHSNKLLHLGFAFDQNFVTPFYVLLSSIFVHCTGKCLVIHVIATGIDEKEEEAIRQFVEANGASITFYAIDAESIRDFVIPKGTEFTLANYYRLFLPLIVPPSVERLLYMDIDTIVVSDLSEIYETNLGAFPIAAVADAVIRRSPVLGINEPGLYFNSGVLLINVSEWKRRHVTKLSMEFIIENPEKISWADQDALNFLLHKSWAPLDARFNVQSPVVPNHSRRKLKSFIDQKVIIHYNSSNKPWKRFCTHRLRFLYDHYLELSPRSLKHQLQGAPLYVAQFKKLVTGGVVNIYLRTPYIRKFWAVTTSLLTRAKAR